MTSYDLVVVGLGSMGSAALYHAARHGLKVLGIEQFNEVPHENGSHHGSTRVIRKAYFEHPGYVPMLLRAYELWEQLERDFGQQILVKQGGLMIGSQSTEVVSGAILAAVRHGLEHEVWTKREVERRYPFLTLDDDQVAVYEPDAGFVYSETAVRAHASLAVRAGAELKMGCRVESWKATENGVEVRLPGEVVYADQLILTVGAWAPEFLPSTPLRVERQVLHWFESGDGRMSGSPIHIVEENDGSTYYGFPSLPGQGVKTALHHNGETCTPATIDREVHPSDVERMRTALSRRIPLLSESRLIKSAACMYTNTADKHFVVGRHPTHSRVTLGVGYSGHGFKFSSAMGELLVGIVLGEPTLDVPEIFAPERFIAP